MEEASRHHKKKKNPKALRWRMSDQAKLMKP